MKIDGLKSGQRLLLKNPDNQEVYDVRILAIAIDGIWLGTIHHRNGYWMSLEEFNSLELVENFTGREPITKKCLHDYRSGDWKTCARCGAASPKIPTTDVFYSSKCAKDTTYRTFVKMENPPELIELNVALHNKEIQK